MTEQNKERLAIVLLLAACGLMCLAGFITWMALHGHILKGILS